MIIPNCHPLTVLKHPSIKSPFQLFSPPKQRSLFLSVMCHYSHCSAAAAPLRSLRAFQSWRCVNCLPQRLKKKANSLTCTDLKAARSTQTLLFGCRIRQKTSPGAFPELWPRSWSAKWHGGQWPALVKEICKWTDKRKGRNITTRIIMFRISVSCFRWWSGAKGKTFSPASYWSWILIGSSQEGETCCFWSYEILSYSNLHAYCSVEMLSKPKFKQQSPHNVFTTKSWS